MPIKEETQMGGRQHPVPQNVMDVEFKIVGDLTVRQVMYLFAGGTLVFIFYKSGLPPFWRWAFMILSGMLAIAVAFVPLQERGLDKWIISFIKALTTPTQRVWKKTYSPPAYFLSDYAEIIKNEIIALTPAKSRTKLDEYLGQIPHELTNLEKKETADLMRIQKLYSQSGLRSATAMSSTKTKISKISKPADFPTLKQIQKSEIKSKQEYVQAHIDTQKNKEGNITVGPIDRPMVNLPSRLKGEIKIEVKNKMPSTIIMEDIKELKAKEKELEKEMAEFLRLVKKAKIEYAKQSRKQKDKRLLSFLDKYNKLKKQKTKISTQLEKSSQKARESREKDKYTLHVSELTRRNIQLEEELRKIQKEIADMKNSNRTKETKKQSPGPEKTLKPKIQPHPKTPARFRPKKKPIAKPTQVSKPPEDITTLPNIIHGTAKDKNGNLLESAVVIIKDSDGDVVRALKTNKLGQFKTQTAVQNGKYTIEVVKGGEKFDIISINAQGAPLSPVVLIGKE